MNFLEQFLIYRINNSGDSKDGDGGKGGTNDSFIISNSWAESPTSSDIILFDIGNSNVATCVLFPRSCLVTGIELCKKVT